MFLKPSYAKETRADNSKEANIEKNSQLLFACLSLTLISCSQKNVSQASISNCKVSTETTDGGIKFVDAPTLDLSEGVNFRLPEELSDTTSILCSRSNLILATTDFLAVMGDGRPLMLIGDEAKVVLEMVNGQFRMRVLAGELSELQIHTAQNAINEAQSISQGE